MPGRPQPLSSCFLTSAGCIFVYRFSKMLSILYKDLSYTGTLYLTNPFTCLCVILKSLVTLSRSKAAHNSRASPSYVLPPQSAFTIAVLGKLVCN